MDALKEALSEPNRNSEAMVSFGYRLYNQFVLNKADRRSKELEWIENLRQYKGIYDPEVRIETGRSKVYPKLSRSKVNIVLSRLHEMLFPETEKNSEMSPTPEPRVSKEVVKHIAKMMMQQDPETGEVIPPSLEDLRTQIKLFAKKTCDRMFSVIDDQFTEMDYKGETKKVLRSGLMYGTGIMKGPLIKKRSKRTWHPSDNGGYEEKAEEEDMPELKFVRIWDWYPDMSVVDIDKMDGSFERHVFSKHELRGLMKKKGFYNDVIIDFIETHPNGNYTAANWEVELQVIEIEASSKTTSVSGANTNPRSSSVQMGKKYEVGEFWGYVDGYDLQACGVDVDDVSLEYACNVWILGQKIIKCVPYEAALDQYKVFYYEKDETSIYGEGLVRVMRSSAIAIGASARMVLDNGAWVAGPEVELNIDLLVPGTPIDEFHSGKIWYRHGRGVDAQYPALRSVGFDSHIPDLLQIIETFKKFADEETTLPTWLIGQVATNETAQATSGRMGMITVSIKDVVKNFDAFTERIMRDMYAWNMEFSPRDDIKGDYNVKATGVSSLVMKEVRMQALNQLSQTMTPEERDWVPEGEFVREKFKAHDITITLRTEEEVKKLREERGNSVQAQMQIEYQKSEIAKNKAQSMSLLTKAKEHNVKAIKESGASPEGEDPRINEAEIAIREAELAKKEVEIARERQKLELDKQNHELEMSESSDSHAMEMAKLAQSIKNDEEKAEMEMRNADAKAKMEMDQKEKAAEHGMKLKDKVATIKAKQKPAAPKKPKK